MHKEEFIKALNDLGININDDQLQMLDTYYKMIIEYNSHTNLTRITEEKEVYLKHFYDSLTLYKAVKLDNQSLLDVGTGAGFPGMVLKIVFPNLKVTLVDSLNKRINFLNEVIKKLNLENIEAIHARMEEYARININKFDVVTARAVAQMHFLLEVAIPMLKINKYFIAMKGNIDNEINYQYALNKLNSKEERIEIFKLPIEKSNRTLIKIKKIKETSKIFPRKYKEIKIKPLF